jgi:hypothetical protein
VTGMATELADQKNLADLYKRDFYAWARHQAEALRDFQATRPNLPLDLEHLIEEVDALADTKLGAVKSQLSRIMVHYLKLEFSPAAPARRKWEVSIVDAQNEVDNDITSSILHEAEQALDRVYKSARRLAAAELRAHDEPEAAASLPETCPYTLDQLLDETWRPTSRHGLVDEAF